MKIGITGHQKTPPSGSWGWVRGEIRTVLRQAGANSEAYSLLAAGADQEFAEEALASGVPLFVVVPCSNYEKAFKDPLALARYRVLLTQIANLKLLDNLEPSEDAYMAAGKDIVDSVDVLVAVWDGVSAAGNGGTDDVVEYAIKRKRPVIHINPVTLQVQRL